MCYWKLKLFKPAAAPTAIFQSLGHPSVPNQIACFLVCYVNRVAKCNILNYIYLKAMLSRDLSGGPCSVVSHAVFYRAHAFCLLIVTKHAVCFE